MCHPAPPNDASEQFSMRLALSLYDEMVFPEGAKPG